MSTSVAATVTPLEPRGSRGFSSERRRSKAGVASAAFGAWWLAFLTLMGSLPQAKAGADLVIFDEGTPAAGYYDASVPTASAPSQLTTYPSPYGPKLVLLTNLAVSGKQNALLEWKSVSGGNWIVFVASPGFQIRDATGYSNVVFFLNGPQAVPATALPRMGLESSTGARTALASLSGFLPEGLDGDANTWQRVVVPLTALQPFGQFNPSQCKTIFFTQGTADNATRTVWLDNLRVTDGSRPAAPSRLVSRAGDRSVVLHWDRNAETDLTGYRVYRRGGAGGSSELVTPRMTAAPGFVDFSVTNGQDYSYTVRALNGAWEESADSAAASATPRGFADDNAFLDYLQQTAFDYFWYEANPTNGLVRDRSQPDSVCSIAAVGFGLTAMGIGIDHGWITRDQARQRVLATLRTFWNGPQGTNSAGTIGHKGWFYHMLGMDDALRAWKSELSSIDTGLLLAGMLYAREYFSQDHPAEAEIRLLADSIFKRVDWAWMCNGGNSLTMGWHPETGFISSRWIGYNEAMVLYLMAFGAATNPLPAAQWASWTSGYAWRTNYGQAYVQFPPLFGHQYSHCWVDFRHSADTYMNNRGITYFENSRRATLAQRAYSIANPGGFAGYASNVWGLTACDGPGYGGYAGYSARGAPPAQDDDGTIAPTAVGGSLPFAPEICLPTLRHMYDRFLTNIWSVYGFRDAFNLNAGWWGPDVLGIDQGPILIMAENYRSQSVWKVFMRSAEIRRGLQAAGFTNLTFVPLKIQRSLPTGDLILTWPASGLRSYQVEHSPDLSTWRAAFDGLLTGGGPFLSWTDSGPPATESHPSAAGQRFYRVFQFGWP